MIVTPYNGRPEAKAQRWTARKFDVRALMPLLTPPEHSVDKSRLPHVSPTPAAQASHLSCRGRFDLLDHAWCLYLQLDAR